MSDLPQLHPIEASRSQGRPIFQSCSDVSSTSGFSSENDPCDFITFLEACQNYSFGFLPLIKQPTLGTLATGGEAVIGQSLENLNMSFAFRRVELEDPDPEMEWLAYQNLIKQLSIFGHPIIRNNPNVLELIGICSEVESPKVTVNGNLSRPVFVFEKTEYGDMDTFISTSVTLSLDFDARLKLCADIVSGIGILHLNREYIIERRMTKALFDHLEDVIHRDIKPENVLVFEDKETPGSFLAKVADLGHASFINDEIKYGLMPRSIPWEAPEWHHRQHTFSDMIKMDVYSLALCCFWILFHEKLCDFKLLRRSTFDGMPKFNVTDPAFSS